MSDRYGTYSEYENFGCYVSMTGLVEYSAREKEWMKNYPFEEWKKERRKLQRKMKGISANYDTYVQQMKEEVKECKS